MSHWLKIKIVVKFLFLYQKVLRDCSICLENIHLSQLYKTECCHCFHKDCIKKWNKMSCPVCRRCIKEELLYNIDFTSFLNLLFDLRSSTTNESRIVNGIGGISFSN